MVAPDCARLQSPGQAATIACRWNDRMRIVCPSCQAAYEVPDKLLAGSPRRVRCARCGNDWVPEAAPATPLAQLPAPAPEPPAPDAAPPEPEAPKPPAAEPERGLPPPPPVRLAPVVEPRAQDKAPATSAGRRLAVLAALGWAASLALLGAAGWAGLAYRDDVMAGWAASRRLYALLGLG
jgi:predicted Zn finger-like uncharacterized protein